MQATLEGKLVELRNLKSEAQLARAVNVLLESPNGEAPFVFGALDKVTSYRLAGLMDPETGLMQPGFFKKEAAKRISPDSCYVLVQPADVMALKEYLKTHPEVSTRLIGKYSGVIGAILPCNSVMAEKVLRGYDFGVANCDSDNISVLHSRATLDLQVNQTLRNLRAEIAVALLDGERGPINQYLVLKDRYNK